VVAGVLLWWWDWTLAWVPGVGGDWVVWWGVSLWVLLLCSVDREGGIEAGQRA